MQRISKATRVKIFSDIFKNMDQTEIKGYPCTVSKRLVMVNVKQNVGAEVPKKSAIFNLKIYTFTISGNNTPDDRHTLKDSGSLL